MVDLRIFDSGHSRYRSRDVCLLVGKCLYEVRLGTISGKAIVH